MDEPTKEIIQRWFIKANNDLQTSKRVIAGDNPILDTACFHAQQCAEKCFKAYLAAIGVHIEKTHDVKRLIIKCSEYDSEFLTLSSKGDNLTRFAASIRYPDDWYEITSEEAKEAIKDAEEIMEFTKIKLRMS